MKKEYASKLRWRATVRLGKSEAKGTNALRTLRTMNEVGRMLGISRQAVHQIERVAMQKLRVALMPALREMAPELAAEVEKKGTTTR